MRSHEEYMYAQLSTKNAKRFLPYSKEFVPVGHKIESSEKNKIVRLLFPSQKKQYIHSHYKRLSYLVLKREDYRDRLKERNARLL